MASSDEDVEILEVRAPEVIALDESDGCTDAKIAAVSTASQMLTPEQLLRRKRKRRLRRLLAPGVIPSFIAIITPDEEKGGDDADDADEPYVQRIRVDVDEYLGLKQKKEEVETTEGSSSVRNVAAKPTSYDPADDGYYEGIVPLAMPEDQKHLGELHILIRQQLEVFSATEEDAQTTQAGRRTRTVRGKVGIRCVHCTKAVKASKQKSWPPGSVSYPLNIAGIYAAAGQKPQLHFKTCPYMPQDLKGQILRLTQGTDVRRMRKADGSAQEIPTVLYYAMSCKRLGLVDVEGGIRFGRDLSLKPLSLESVRADVEQHSAAYKRNQERYGTKSSHHAKKPPPKTSSPMKEQVRLKADAESEKVLEETIAEPDSPAMLGRADDLALLSEFFFLCIRSMRICHVVPQDFESRGKRTKKMQLGFAGFCCRHCTEQQGDKARVVEFSCRTFTSSPDNMSSSISSSFYNHLLKCTQVPPRVRKAIIAYKKIHSKQLARLPHGSQRRLLGVLWTRLRAADISPDDMKEKLMLDDAPSAPSQIGIVPEPAPPSSLPTPEGPVSSARLALGIGERPPGFPSCDDIGTVQLLQYSATINQDVNDGLIRPEDQPLVSDYVFFIMKQLKMAQPTQADFSRGRRMTNMSAKQAGLCCRHCHVGEHLTSLSGRSFPSQPDNMASSINTSLYSHMQRCEKVPGNIKIALGNLKRLHTQQCSSLPFGSQRQYFNRVFERLRSVKVENFHSTEKTIHVKTESPSSSTTIEGDIAGCNFMKITDELYECCLCRVLPVSLRASGSVLVGKVDLLALRDHSKRCQGNCLDLSNVVHLVTYLINDIPSFELNTLSSEPYRKLLQALFGLHNPLVEVFSDRLASFVLRRLESSDKSTWVHEVVDIKHLWSEFPASVAFEALEAAFASFAATLEGVDPRLHRENRFVRLLQLICPSFTATRAHEVTDTKKAPDDVGSAFKTGTESASAADQANSTGKKAPAATGAAGEAPSTSAEPLKHALFATSSGSPTTKNPPGEGSPSNSIEESPRTSLPESGAGKSSFSHALFAAPSATPETEAKSAGSSDCTGAERKGN